MIAGILSKLSLNLRIALRDLLGDRRGFGIFIACIIIGVAAIAGVSSLSFSLAQGLSREGRTILGGDASISLMSRALSQEQKDYLLARGSLSELSLLRAMAHQASGETSVIEIKAIDPATYPAFGALTLNSELPLLDALTEKKGLYGLIVETTLLTRLDVKLGDIITIGNQRFEIRSTLINEPDKLAGGIGFGPRVFMSRSALEATGLATPGAIIRNLTRIRLAGNPSDQEVKNFHSEINSAFPNAGWEIRTRDAVSPQFSRNLDRFTQLLSLIALTALIAGGAGVANSVREFTERKRTQFAILKALGASGSQVFAIALIQITIAGLIATFLGLILGSLIPIVAASWLQQISDLPFTPSINLQGILTGGCYGLLVTFIFAVIPLGRIHEMPVSRLLRDDDQPLQLWRYSILSAVAALFLAGLTLLSASDVKLGVIYIIGVFLIFASLRAASWSVVFVLKKFAHPNNPLLRLALANIWRPKSIAPSLIISAGLTQTLLIALALVEGAVHHELIRADSSEIPNFYFLDIPKTQTEHFNEFLKITVPDAHIEHVPMMRGRIIELKGKPLDRYNIADEAKWVLECDRGITFSENLPNNSTLTAGNWWEKNYAGAPLVSLEQKVAEGFGLKIGDQIKVNVLGRDFIATVSNFRKVDWRSYAINFVMVFSPNTFKAAPYTELFTISYAAPSLSERDNKDALLTRQTAKEFPNIVSIRVKDVLTAVDKIATQLAFAARAATVIALATAGLALTSAIISSQRARLYDTVIYKILGAPRRWLMTVYALEFGLLGLVASMISLLAGNCFAFGFIKYIMKIDFVFPATTLILIMSSALMAIIALGLMLSWRILTHPAASALRRL
ncbi:MAG: ABC transporter permease [Methylocystis sp.]